MRYSEMLQQAIALKRMSLAEISSLIQERGYKTNKAYLSKLQNGKLPPAGDGLNQVLADVLDIDPVELKAAAYREKIPADVLEKLQAHPKATSA
ncbi:XRE family transcriptional regulator [Brevibacillus agri]|uniref:XRE family transcriptional regulator n=1 Tax=Brevibacillus agri TaxID=51101 RepID=UPI001C8D632A|nr:XRE family transcriptional regulator [Brevibacillus agri]MBY0052939.1 XRE family transcriptional regulator [Brevibacillus agri]